MYIISFIVRSPLKNIINLFIFTPVVLLISWQPFSELSHHQLGDHEPLELDEYLREKQLRYFNRESTSHMWFSEGAANSAPKKLKVKSFKT